MEVDLAMLVLSRMATTMSFCWMKERISERGLYQGMSLVILSLYYSTY